jgi:hypothetical protein
MSKFWLADGRIHRPLKPFAPQPDRVAARYAPQVGYPRPWLAREPPIAVVSLTASTTPEAPLPLLQYIDVVLIAAAAPIMLLIGVPAVGYLVAVGVWVLVRAVGTTIDRYVAAADNTSQALTLKLVYMIVRLFVLALTVVLVRQGAGKNDGLTALLVIVFAFTIALGLSFANRAGSR